MQIKTQTVLSLAAAYPGTRLGMWAFRLGHAAFLNNQETIDIWASNPKPLPEPAKGRWY